MSLTIHKYEIPLSDHIRIAMPMGAQVLSVGVQRGKPVLWAKVDPAKPPVFLTLSIRGTGHDAEGLGPFIGTLLLDDGDLVLHVFGAHP